MSNNHRNGFSHYKTASAQDLMQKLKHVGESPARQENLLRNKGIQLPIQQPAFLGNLPPLGTLYTPKQPITQQLKTIIDEHYYTAAFEGAISRVSAQNVPELDQIKNLYQFYYYVDALVTWIPEIRVWDWNGDILHERSCYLRITQFYYYFNQPELEALQSPIAPLVGEHLSPLSAWLRNFAVEWGAFLDTEESQQYLSSFKFAPEYAWQDYQKEPEQYPTFNAFFARQFKDIDMQRPIAQLENDRVITFPAESTFVGQWTISTDVGDPLPAPPSIVVKHIEWPIEELLQDSQYNATFAGGIFCHSFLNTYDYHRMHTPVRGKVLEAKFIPGQVYLKVLLEELSKTESEDKDSDIARALIARRYLDAQDATGYQFVQCRGLLVLESPIGKVAILAMGMAQVSSVIFVKNGQAIELSDKEKMDLTYYQQVAAINKKLERELVGQQLEKGDMFSFFQFGGSDCVMVFERRANITITAQTGVHYPVRSQYAISNIERLLE